MLQIQSRHLTEKSSLFYGLPLVGCGGLVDYSSTSIPRFRASANDSISEYTFDSGR